MTFYAVPTATRYDMNFHEWPLMTPKELYSSTMWSCKTSIETSSVVKLFYIFITSIAIPRIWKILFVYNVTSIWNSIIFLLRNQNSSIMRLQFETHLSFFKKPNPWYESEISYLPNVRTLFANKSSFILQSKKSFFNPIILLREPIHDMDLKHSTHIM